MSTTVEDVVVGASRREAIVWAGVAVALFVATFLFVGRDGLQFSDPLLVVLVGSLLAGSLAAVQAGRNGSLALSWLLTGAPVVALDGLLWLRTGLPVGLDVLLVLLVVVGFVGTVAHLLGMETARSLGAAPRPTSRTERLGLVAVWVGTGGLVVVRYVGLV